MTDKKKASPGMLSPRLQKVRDNLERFLADYDLSQQEYNALIEDMKKRRRRIEGAGDNILDDLPEE
ncbi:hypothetical protein KKH27_13160 [bacterium]|nr:hypothetical protein [bacterium]MBU1983258.1 hypothetical protein [bacterium]